MKSPLLPVGETKVAAPGTVGRVTLKLISALHGPIPTEFHVCTFQVKAPPSRFGVSPAIEQVLAPQTAELSYHFVNVELEGPLTDS